ncbi:MAG: hypothetical protein LDL24_08175 [Treponema sp.]|nr:hypothetical protein [Treponema sp.]
MEERKKRLTELVKKRENYQDRLSEQYRNLGNSILSAEGDDSSPISNEKADFRRLNRELQNLTSKVERLGDLLKNEGEKKAQYKKLLSAIKVDEKELGLRNIALGASILALSEVPDPIFTLKQQYEAVLHQLEETEDHLSLLEEEEAKDFFSFIGKQSRKLVLKAARSSKERDIKKICLEAGQALVASDIELDNYGEEAVSLLASAREIAKQLEHERNDLAKESAALEELAKEIRELCQNTAPARTLKILDKELQGVRNELAFLLEHTGQKVAAIDVESQNQYAEWSEMIHGIHELQSDLQSLERNIEVLSAELEIEKLQKEIDKLNQVIRSHQVRQEREAKIIADTQSRIRELQNGIEKFQRVLE